MKAALAEVSLTLHHYHMGSLGWDLFHADVVKVRIVGKVGPPQTDRVG